MSNPPGAAGNHGGDGSNNDLEKIMAKTAGVLVISGIAISILKSLNPFNNSNPTKMEPLTESTRNEKAIPKPPPPCCRSSQPQPLLQVAVTTSVEPNVKEAVEQNQNVVESTGKAVKIVKGDTLWGLSRKYGVPIKEIKEANGLTSDTIYAGKKLIIP